MSKQYFGEEYGSKPPENYERFFVPAIGEPVANDLIRLAALRPGERVLDVACGTGVVARLAAQQVGSKGTVVGVDIHPGMLQVARSSTPANLSLEWHQASADDMPLPDAAFDVVLCQLGLEFMQDKTAALAEMYRVLVPGGRIILNVPAPASKLFTILAAAMKQHISPQAAGFINQVFSLDDTTAIHRMMSEAGFRDVALQVNDKLFNLPPSKDFLWQYVSSTPLAAMAAQADEAELAALEREVVEAWQEFEGEGSLMYRQHIIEVTARK